ncbi:MAG: hypothetical protein NC901_03220, partial [Candidatus Omnitrophica bacterium]|nr:hypothetical protein [Candidatus Omnitrophota bacterium]
MANINDNELWYEITYIVGFEVLEALKGIEELNKAFESIAQKAKETGEAIKASLLDENQLNELYTKWQKSFSTGMQETISRLGITVPDKLQEVFQRIFGGRNKFAVTAQSMFDFGTVDEQVSSFINILDKVLDKVEKYQKSLILQRSKYIKPFTKTIIPDPEEIKNEIDELMTVLGASAVQLQQKLDAVFATYSTRMSRETLQAISEFLKTTKFFEDFDVSKVVNFAISPEQLSVAERIMR